MTIGVFDSGVGGLSVARAIKKALPEMQVISVDDKKHLPYGSKSPKELFVLVRPILEDLARKCAVIVVACNTVSTTLIGSLRQLISVPLIAMEPMVKPAAALTQSKVIAVCATPTTLASPRYAYLKKTYAKGIKILEPDCSDWTRMIESSTIDQRKIHLEIDTVCRQNADVIVLGCTHYHWIEDIIKELANGRAQVLQPEVPVIAQLKQVLARLD